MSPGLLPRRQEGSGLLFKITEKSTQAGSLLHAEAGEGVPAGTPAVITTGSRILWEPGPALPSYLS